MSRRTTVLGFSVSPELAHEYEKLAAKEGTMKSELFPKMIQTYKTHLKDEEFFRIQR